MTSTEAQARLEEVEERMRAIQETRKVLERDHADLYFEHKNLTVKIRFLREVEAGRVPNVKSGDIVKDENGVRYRVGVVGEYDLSSHDKRFMYTFMGDCMPKNIVDRGGMFQVWGIRLTKTGTEAHKELRPILSMKLEVER